MCASSPPERRVNSFAKAVRRLERCRLEGEIRRSAVGTVIGHPVLVAVARQEGRNIVDLKRPACDITLNFRTSRARQTEPLLRRFDTFGDHAHVERLRQADDGGEQRVRFRGLAKIVDERFVDFYFVDGSAEGS